MSDEAAEKFEQELKAARADGSVVQGRSVTVTITLQPDGQLEMSGPLQNKILMNGLLGAAIQQLHAMHLKSELVAMAKTSNSGGLAGMLKKMGRG